MSDPDTPHDGSNSMEMSNSKILIYKLDLGEAWCRVHFSLR